MNFHERQLDLLEYDKPRQHYYVLESVTAQNLKIIHVVTKHLVAVGRGLENEIRITDISVSRDHAILRWSRDGSIYVQDLLSKFGSAVQVQKPTLLQNQTLQIGRSLVKCRVYQNYNWMDWLCCLKKNKAADFDKRSL